MQAILHEKEKFEKMDPLDLEVEQRFAIGCHRHHCSAIALEEEKDEVDEASLGNLGG